MRQRTPESPTNKPSKPPRRAAAGGVDRLALGLLAAALLLGLLRFWRLGEWSLWVDEAYTFADARHGLASEEIWNPLGYRLLIGVADLLGPRPDEFGLRFLPALVGWGCIPLAWWAFRTWLGDRRAALVALLLALSSWHVFWSQNARFYTFAMGTSLVGSGVFLRGLLTGGVGRALLGLAVTAAGAAFHATAALIVPALCLAPWFVGLRAGELPEGMRRVSRWLLGALLVGAAAGGAWLTGALDQHIAHKGTEDLLRGPMHLGLTVGYFFTPLVGLAAVVGALWSWLRKDVAGLFACAVGVLVLGGAMVISTRVLMTAQYVFCLLPWVLALSVMPLASVGSGRRVWVFGVGLVLIVSGAANTALYFTSRAGERPRWREAYTFVDERREPGDLVLGMGSEIGEFYIGAQNADPRSPRAVLPIGNWHTQAPLRWARHGRRIWVVVRPQWFEALGESEGLFRGWLESDFEMLRSFPVEMQGRDLEVRVYLRE